MVFPIEVLINQLNSSVVGSAACSKLQSVSVILSHLRLLRMLSIHRRYHLLLSFSCISQIKLHVPWGTCTPTQTCSCEHANKLKVHQVWISCIWLHSVALIRTSLLYASGQNQNHTPDVRHLKNISVFNLVFTCFIRKKDLTFVILNYSSKMITNHLEVILNTKQRMASLLCSHI